MYFFNLHGSVLALCALVVIGLGAIAFRVRSRLSRVVLVCLAMAPFTVMAIVASATGGHDTPIMSLQHQALNPSAAMISVTKNPVMQYAITNTSATFTVTVVNPGTVNFTGVTVDDPLAPGCSRTLGAMAAGAHVTYVCTMGVGTVDITNHIFVTGTAPGPVSASASASALVHVIEPSLFLRQSPDPIYVEQGGTATVTIVLSNTGNITLTGVYVRETPDTLPPGVTTNCERPPADYSPKTGITYTCLITGVQHTFEHNLYTRGWPPVGPYSADRDLATIQVATLPIAIVKGPKEQTVIGSSRVTFTIILTNTGNTSLTGVQVSDPLAPDCDRQLAILNVRQGFTYTCAVETGLGEVMLITNTATVAVTPAGSVMIAYSDTARAMIIPFDLPLKTYLPRVSR